jgi:hypothetical protein
MTCEIPIYRCEITLEFLQAPKTFGTATVNRGQAATATAS